MQDPCTTVKLNRSVKL